MKVNICNLGNKEWLDFKADISFGLYFALKDLKFDVEMSVNELKQGRLNILLGADFLAGDEKAVQQFLNAKVDYVIYEVENFDGKTINNRPNFNILNYKALIERAAFIVTPYRKNIGPYQAIVASERVKYARWGFYEQLRSERIERGRCFEFDALYFGMLKGDRMQKLRYLLEVKKSKVKVLSRSDPLALRDYYVSACRWGLNISYGNAEKFTNPFRLYYMAANGMPILSDLCTDDDGYLELCEVSDFSVFADRMLDSEVDIKSLLERCRVNLLADNLRDVF